MAVGRRTLALGVAIGLGLVGLVGGATAAPERQQTVTVDMAEGPNRFEPRDIWVGAYWKRWPKALEVFVCIVPMVPIRVYVQWH